MKCQIGISSLNENGYGGRRTMPFEVPIWNLKKGQKPTEEQLQEVEEAKKHPIVFDEDCPELSPAMYKAFRSSVIQRNRKKNV